MRHTMHEHCNTTGGVLACVSDHSDLLLANTMNTVSHV